MHYHNKQQIDKAMYYILWGGWSKSQFLSECDCCLKVSLLKLLDRPQLRDQQRGTQAYEDEDQ